MAVLQWDQAGQRTYETGVDRGVLYSPNAQGAYTTGVAWNGLVSVTESPSGAEANPQYADNIKYLNLQSAEEFGATVEAFTYPPEFAKFDGSVALSPGVVIGQQTRTPFGLAYRTRIGNDLLSTDFGYKLHLVYGAQASPSEKAYSTVNDSPEAITFSWELTTTATEVPGFKPTAILTVDSTKVSTTALQALEQILYGTAGTDPRLPLPAEVLALFAGTITTTAVPTGGTYNSTSKVLTIPNITGVDYFIDGAKQTAGGTVTLTKNTVLTARPQNGYKFPDTSVDRFYIAF